MTFTDDLDEVLADNKPMKLSRYGEVVLMKGLFGRSLFFEKKRE